MAVSNIVIKFTLHYLDSGTSLIVASLAQEKEFYLCIHMHKSSLEQELNIMYTTIDSILC